MQLLPLSEVANPSFANKADFISQMSQAIRDVAPEFNLPSRPTDVFVTAHMALSTGWGRHARGWNLSGIKAPASWTGKAFQTPAFEYDSAGNIQNITATWKAFDSPQAFLRDGYMRLVSTPMYAAAKEKLAYGDLSYMAALGQAGWYTAPITQTSAEWQSLVNTIKTQYPDALEDHGLGVALLFAIGLGGAWWWTKRRRA